MKRAFLIAACLILFLKFCTYISADRYGNAPWIEAFASSRAGGDGSYNQRADLGEHDPHHSGGVTCGLVTALMRRPISLDDSEDDSEEESEDEGLNSESLDDLTTKLRGKTREKVLEIKGEPDRIVNGVFFYETECHDPGTKARYEKFVVIFGADGKCLKISGYDEI